jgi:hypothetical protein
MRHHTSCRNTEGAVHLDIAEWKVQGSVWVGLVRTHGLGLGLGLGAGVGVGVGVGDWLGLGFWGQFALKDACDPIAYLSGVAPFWQLPSINSVALVNGREACNDHAFR